VWSWPASKPKRLKSPMRVRYVWNLVIDPADSSPVYTATQYGSNFVSYDGGQTWN
jgi:hypothetical protein